MLPDGIMNGIAALSDFATNARRGLEGEQRVSEGVVADYVSTPGNFGDDVWTPTYIAANHKKGGMNVMPGENLQQMESVWVIWAIVESQCDLP
jgi:hypothetical protein